MGNTHTFAVNYVLVFALSVIVTTGAVQAESAGDASITLEAQEALRAALGTRVSAVVVDTRNGFVTLHGKVKRQGLRSTAAKVVWGVPGVSGMRNLLQVVSHGDSVLMQRSDDVVRADIERMLRADRSLDDSRITVRSVSNGVVLLGGDASSMIDDVHVLRATADRPGVRQVFSEIEGTVAVRPELVPALAAER
jgi:osmotically-inducible protein OsmY